MAEILVIDDDPAIRLLVKILLKKQGHDVITAERGEEGIRMLNTTKPKLILLDVMMPGLSGYETCKRIKGTPKFNKISVIMFTVRSGEKYVKEAQNCGADGFISKPFITEEFLRTVNDFL